MASESRFERWARTGMICLSLVLVAAVTYDCSGRLGQGLGVTIYGGFNQKCEAAGGIVVDRMCLKTENLIELPLGEGAEDDG